MPARPCVVLTREAEDNAALADALAALGVPVRQIPCTSTRYLRPAAPPPTAAVAFSSRRAVNAWIAAGLQTTLLGASPPLVAAVGQATADALHAEGLPVHLVAEPPTGQVLGQLLHDLLPAGAEVLVPSGDLMGGGLLRTLAALGRPHQRLVVYENPTPPLPALEPFPVAAAFVAAPSAAERLLQALPWMRHVPFLAVGPTTEAALRRLGAKHILAVAATLDEQRHWLTFAWQQATLKNPSGESMQRPASTRLFQKAVALMPGGVSSPVRAFRSVGGNPLFFHHAAGGHVFDVDGHELVDFCLSWGPLILGHAHPLVVEAVRDAAGRGLSFGACCAAEAELAERILAAFPAMEQVRFVSSGTEAVMTALRLARGVTGRPRILKFEGGYHGHSDSLLVKAGSGLATFGTSSSAGVPEDLARLTVVCGFDDEQALEQVFALHGAELAAVVVEPLPGNNGLLEQRLEWMQTLRRLCDAHGTLLILDEVISGFRLQYGGYGDMAGVRADIVTLGKIIGGGMPVGALVGPRAIMEQLAPVGPVYQAGTLSGNPVSLAAGIATLDLLADGKVYQQLETLGQAFDAVLAEAAIDRPWLRWRRLGSLIWLHLAEGEVPRRADTIDTGAIQRLNAMHRPLLDRGFYLPPSAYELLFLCTAHHVDEVRSLALALVETAE